MKRYIDYEELWNTLTISERAALLNMLYSNDMTDQALKKPWAELEGKTKQALIRLDWEFALGHRF